MRHHFFYTWQSVFLERVLSGISPDERRLRRAWRIGLDPSVLAAEVLQAHELRGAAHYRVSGDQVQEVLSEAARVAPSAYGRAA